MPTPHRLLDEALNGLADGAKGVGGTVTGGLKGAGGSLMSALDKPLMAVSGKEGPHRIIDRALNGALAAVQTFLTNGVIDALKTEGEGICRALDQPKEQVGLPPDLGNGLKFPAPPWRR